MAIKRLSDGTYVSHKGRFVIEPGGMNSTPWMVRDRATGKGYRARTLLDAREQCSDLLAEPIVCQTCNEEVTELVTDYESGEKMCRDCEDALKLENRIEGEEQHEAGK